MVLRKRYGMRLQELGLYWLKEVNLQQVGSIEACNKKVEPKLRMVFEK